MKNDGCRRLGVGIAQERIHVENDMVRFISLPPSLMQCKINIFHLPPSLMWYEIGCKNQCFGDEGTTNLNEGDEYEWVGNGLRRNDERNSHLPPSISDVV
ncbi:hypothetical protein I3842_07G020500 [Carya illinoinensis]|uniref:Uncharacterized protein n=1 Tax=Carya illinoinensis TaxID=32201 RepID=A0A922EHH2_CARIL|nr:hypothetical protein I3842_07G020500 [Carya illinoinensis]